MAQYDLAPIPDLNRIILIQEPTGWIAKDRTGELARHENLGGLLAKLSGILEER